MNHFCRATSKAPRARTKGNVYPIGHTLSVRIRCRGRESRTAERDGEEQVELFLGVSATPSSGERLARDVVRLLIGGRRLLEYGGGFLQQRIPPLGDRGHVDQLVVDLRQEGTIFLAQ